MGRLAIPIRRETYEGAFKGAVAALRDAEVPFACMGSLALWALGGPAPNLQQDLDFAVCETDVERAREALQHAGFAIEQPPEDWLFKAWSRDVEGPGSALVDLIYRPSGIRITHDLLAGCDTRNLLALEVRVLHPTDLLVSKLHSITEQEADYTSTLQFARSLRELIDWDEVATRVDTTPFGTPFIELASRLGIAEPGDSPIPAPEASRLEQLVGEHDRAAVLDLKVSSQRGRIVLRGEAANTHHREEVEQVVRELAPGAAIENRILVREYVAIGTPEAIG